MRAEGAGDVVRTIVVPSRDRGLRRCDFAGEFGANPAGSRAVFPETGFPLWRKML
jgi:hypothetical protein